MIEDEQDSNEFDFEDDLDDAPCEGADREFNRRYVSLLRLTDLCGYMAAATFHVTAIWIAVRIANYHALELEGFSAFAAWIVAFGIAEVVLAIAALLATGIFAFVAGAIIGLCARLCGVHPPSRQRAD